MKKSVESCKKINKLLYAVRTFPHKKEALRIRRGKWIVARNRPNFCRNRSKKINKLLQFPQGSAANPMGKW